ncbi:bifunctional phosphoribosylaminoimidazolecarboxamide formyltransferase/IMP cyclohydrolase [Bacillaceae bacterium SIJ1]|uniref:bifunctional phosphoribosylaminoimidazolecarboxamide formyltransferase/IMP cyclohydrolase n=1 Tax=Litoribacterium kuwaitense TaxID=1398745 RepID=UPI0013ECD8B7|nr:bifunctional phosphoribosylaminoimidazolecarboxamide formyltransferase/IMP cyclohydrolase [Litoribacterium kuwaitense]NGP46075.1 bifunctional phosphoribosylaminoimidazolecarboxamide formyltransferase/IMP cyclohydrolase [Litoribacterium kuwaitense]
MSVKRALVSVSNKAGIEDLAKGLLEAGVEVISTGGTKKALEEAGLAVTGISEVTGFPEIMDGRVKTLHPAIHGGLLAVRNNPEHQQALAEQRIEPIDLVVVNLYPFKETIQKEVVTFADAIENIDIGGPSMIRSAAKNHGDVTVVVDPSDYDAVLAELAEGGAVSEDLRKRLAAKAFRHTAQYDALIASFLTEQVGEEYPESLTVSFEKKQSLRYGENPHQTASFYESALAVPDSLSQAEQLNGKELSYNNINDANAALELVKEFTQPAVVAVKHMNPCGVGLGSYIDEAYDRAYEADPVSIFGGIVAFNKQVGKETAQKMKELFLEVIIAPSFTDDALEILKQKKNLRLLTVPFDVESPIERKFTSVHGGLLVQQEDTHMVQRDDMKVVTKRSPNEQEWHDLELAWTVVKHVKSNAIVLVKDNGTIGVGAGQMNRVGSAKIAIEQAGDKATHSVMGSDAFFPMKDTVEQAAKAGITAIIQPGGSIRDEESIEEADRHNIAMVFTSVRHFKH